MKKLVIIGAGGFAKSIIDALNTNQYELIGFIDSYKTGTHQGYKILTNSISDLKDKEKYLFFIGIGEPSIREYYYNELKKYNLNLATIIDKTAILSRNIKIGKGVFIGKMVIVNADAILQDNVVLNTRSLIEHGNHIGEHTNVSTNSVLNGDVIVGNKTFIGSSAVVNGQIKIGSNSIIGSGSVVIRDIEDNSVVAGSPTRLIRRNNNE